MRCQICELVTLHVYLEHKLPELFNAITLLLFNATVQCYYSYLGRQLSCTMANSYLGRSSVIFLVIVLIVQSNHGLSVDKPHSLDIDASSVWIYASTISEVSKIAKFRSYGRSTMMDSKIVTPGDVKCCLILKLVKAFMMANLIVLSGDVSVNPGPSFGRVDFGEAAQVQGQGQGTITDTTVFGKLHTCGISISERTWFTF